MRIVSYLSVIMFDVHISGLDVQFSVIILVVDGVRRIGRIKRRRVPQSAGALATLLHIRRRRTLSIAEVARFVHVQP